MSPKKWLHTNPHFLAQLRARGMSMQIVLGYLSGFDLGGMPRACVLVLGHDGYIVVERKRPTTFLLASMAIRGNLPRIVLASK